MTGFKFSPDRYRFVRFSPSDSAGGMISNARVRCGYSQAALAESMGVSVRTVQAFEQNRRSLVDCSFSSVMAFCHYCGVRPSEVFAWYAKLFATSLAFDDFGEDVSNDLFYKYMYTDLPSCNVSSTSSDDSDLDT